MFKINFKKFFLQFFLYGVFLMAAYEILNMEFAYYFKFLIKCFLLTIYLFLMAKLIGFDKTLHYLKLTFEFLKKTFQKKVN